MGSMLCARPIFLAGSLRLPRTNLQRSNQCPTARKTLTIARRKASSKRARRQELRQESAEWAREREAAQEEEARQAEEEKKARQEAARPPPKTREEANQRVAEAMQNVYAAGLSLRELKAKVRLSEGYDEAVGFKGNRKVSKLLRGLEAAKGGLVEARLERALAAGGPNAKGEVRGLGHFRWEVGGGTEANAERFGYVFGCCMSNGNPEAAAEVAECAEASGVELPEKPLRALLAKLGGDVEGGGVGEVMAAIREMAADRASQEA